MKVSPRFGSKLAPRRRLAGALSAILFLASAVAASFPAAHPCEGRPDCLCCPSRAECRCPENAPCGCNASMNDGPVAFSLPSAGFAAPLPALPPALLAANGARASLPARSAPVDCSSPAPDTPPPEA